VEGLFTKMPNLDGLDASRMEKLLSQSAFLSDRKGDFNNNFLFFEINALYPSFTEQKKGLDHST